MEQFQHTVQNPEGIHARPAGLLAKQAQKYQSSIVIAKQTGKQADLKRLIAVMGLSVKQGETVTLTIDGADEQTAAQELKAFMEANF